MIIKLDEKNHIYTIDGEIASISTTELLHKHGLAPNYSKVSEEKLKESAKIGKEVHKDLEYVLNKAGYEPKTKQGRNFLKWVQKNIECAVGEQKLGLDYKGMLVCGTADVMGIMKDGSYFIGDHKNTATFNREYVSWQVSINDYMARKLGNEAINGKLLNWKGASKFYCLQYDKATGRLKTYELDKVSDIEIERLLECEYKGEIYKRSELVIDKDLSEELMRVENELYQIEKHKKEVEDIAKGIRKQICELCERQGVYSWESPDKSIKITYVFGMEKLITDSTKLRAEYPMVWEKCQKISRSKPYVKIKLRNNEEEYDE